jgi:glucose/arabinose dehydrogenase
MIAIMMIPLLHPRKKASRYIGASLISAFLAAQAFLAEPPWPAFAQDRVTPTPTTTAEPATNLPNGNSYTWNIVAEGFDRPVLLTHAPDQTGRLFVAEQGGLIFIVKNGNLMPTPFLDLTTQLTEDMMRGGYTELGLLGLVFHPQYAENGVFFVNYTNVEGNTILARYRVSDDPDIADPTSVVTLLSIPQPYDNHNGGGMAFGPDGYLYMATGDGGGAGDPQGNAQKLDSLHGKILRLDVRDLAANTYAIPPDNPFVGRADARPEIWAWGLRNPWRWSFDRETGDMYIADVGQWAKEEINFQPAGSKGGENYGWNFFEGDQRYELDPPDGTPVFRGEVTIPVVPPVVVYDHAQGCSVTGGFVYRGQRLTGLSGFYLYGDYCNGRVWVMGRQSDGAWQTETFSNTERQIASFGEDMFGELYLVDYKGTILRLDPK